MGEGLRVYKQDDIIFNMAFIQRVIITGFMTGAYFIIAKKYNFFRDPALLNKSIPVAALFSFYYSKGLALNYLATKHSQKMQHEKDKHYLDHYHHKLREQKLI
jgi:hypothetical protein